MRNILMAAVHHLAANEQVLVKHGRFSAETIHRLQLTLTTIATLGFGGPEAPPEQKGLRDEIAMSALSGICANLSMQHVDETFDKTRGGKIVSETAYMYADAMLEARDK